MSAKFGTPNEQISYPTQMNVKWISRAVAIVNNTADRGDYESAHELEDELLVLVMQYIAGGHYSEAADALCEAALESTENTTWER